MLSDMGIGGVGMSWRGVWGVVGVVEGCVGSQKHILINGANIIHDDKLTAPWVNCHLGGN